MSQRPRRRVPTPVRKWLSILRDNWYRCTWTLRSLPGTTRLRPLPHFIIIGAMRSGTTSLFSYVAQYPQILQTDKKEIHFFDWKYARGEYWYRSHFPYMHTMNSDTLVGEASPYYMFCPHSAKRIHDLIPDAKIIAVLRNPTERAISHYFHSVKGNRETLPIIEAMRAEEERTRSHWDRLLRGDSFRNPPLIHFTYKRRGLYLQQLERYWRHFDKEQILVESSEDLFAKPLATLAKVFRFLGVESDFQVPDLKRANVGHNRTEVPIDVRQYLDNYFRPYNEALYERLGRDFAWTQSTSP